MDSLILRSPLERILLPVRYLMSQIWSQSPVDALQESHAALEASLSITMRKPLYDCYTK